MRAPTSRKLRQRGASRLFLLVTGGCSGRRVDAHSGEPAQRPYLLAPHPGAQSRQDGEGCKAMSTTTESITETARAFFDACETGKCWAVCSAYCQPGASFAAQAEPLAGMQTLEQYTDWMKGMLVVLPDESYEVKS